MQSNRLKGEKKYEEDIWSRWIKYIGAGRTYLNQLNTKLVVLTSVSQVPVGEGVGAGVGGGVGPGVGGGVGPGVGGGVGPGVGGGVGPGVGGGVGPGVGGGVGPGVGPGVGGSVMDGTSFWRKRSQYPSSSARTLSSALFIAAAAASPLVGSFLRRMRLVAAFCLPFLSALAASTEVMATVATQSAVAATMNFIL